MEFQVSGVSSALVRLKPTKHFKECWDLLLVVCAVAQLSGSAWHLVVLFFFSFGDVFCGGDLCTLWWWWCSFATSVLVLHKKVHARWWTSSNWDHKTMADSDLVCCGLIKMPRTPSPVHVLSNAPGVIDDGPSHEPATSVVEGERLLGRLWRTAAMGVLVRLRPYAYRYYHMLAAGDDVLICSQPFWNPRRNEVGKLLEADPGQDCLHAIEFLDGTVERFPRKDFELYETVSLAGGWSREENVEEGVSHNMPRGPGQWHDRLTSALLRSTVALWALSALLLLLLPVEVVTDDDGYMSLHVVKGSDAAATRQVTGFILAVQVSCIGSEWLIRFVTWAVSRLCLLLVYANM